MINRPLLDPSVTTAPVGGGSFIVMKPVDTRYEMVVSIAEFNKLERRAALAENPSEALINQFCNFASRAADEALNHPMYQSEESRIKCFSTAFRGVCNDKSKMVKIWRDFGIIELCAKTR